MFNIDISRHKTVGLAKLFISIVIVSICVAPFFLFTNYYSLFDNEELHLLARLTPNLSEFMTANWPYTVSNLLFFWLPGEFLASESIEKYRLPSMIIGVICLATSALVAYLFARKIWVALLFTICIAFSFQVQRYTHWGISGYIGALGFSTIILYYFYNLINDKNTGTFRLIAQSVVITVAYLFIHPDLFFQLFALSLVISLYWYYSNRSQELTIRSNVQNTIKHAWPFSIYFIGLIVFLLLMPENMTNVGIRKHQQHLFFSTSGEAQNIFGFFTFYLDKSVDLFRRTLLNSSFNSGSLVSLYLTLGLFVYGGVSSLFPKIQKYHQQLKFIYFYILVVMLTLVILNLMGVHQIGQPRYSLYLVTPVILTLVLTLSGSILALSERLKVEKAVSLLIYPLLVFTVLFAFVKEMDQRMKVELENKKLLRYLEGSYDLVFADERYYTLLKELYPTQYSKMVELGNATPGRVKPSPSKELMNKMERENLSILSVTAFVSMTQVSVDSIWGYSGYDFMGKSYCKSGSTKNGRLLVERWVKCEPSNLKE